MLWYTNFAFNHPYQKSRRPISVRYSVNVISFPGRIIHSVLPYFYYNTYEVFDLGDDEIHTKQ